MTDRSFDIYCECGEYLYSVYDLEDAEDDMCEECQKKTDSPTEWFIRKLDKCLK